MAVNEVVEAQGVLEKTYPKIFVVKLDKEHAVKRLSYTYADILTQTVELTIDDDNVEAANM